MKSTNRLILSTSPLSQPASKPRKTASLARQWRPLYGRKKRYLTVKERDTETGLYYYGARYLDSKTSRWLSGDPAVGDYVPSAPVNDEARKRNKNLPGQGGVFNYVNLHVYHYAGNNPVRYTDPDGMSAWEHTSEWDNEAIRGYREFVAEQTAKYEANGQKFTCEDLALSLLIDYASQNGLPVSITNNSGSSGAEKILSSKSDSFNSVEDFKKSVLSTTGANDLMKPANTVAASWYAQGDMLLLDTGIPGGVHDGRMSHVQVITGFHEGSMSIAQGSTSGSGSSNPNRKNYIGVPITRGSYNLMDNSYSRIGGSRVENGMRTFGTFTRRWNFLGMN